MRFREKFRDFKERLADRHMVSVIMALLVVAVTVFSYEAKVSADYKTRLDAQYARAFDDLTEYVSTIETSLYKCAAVTEAKSVVRLANDIYAKAAAASTCLGQLPLSDAHLENTAKFLAQVGDFTHMLALGYMDTPVISEEARRTMVDLSKYAASLTGGLYDMQQKIYSGALQFGTPYGQNKDGIASSMEELESQFQDYPSLIYDGPFSDHLEDREPLFLQNVTDISMESARARLAEFTAPENLEDVTDNGESGGHIPTYMFTARPKDAPRDRAITFQLAKRGGMLLEMLDNRAVQEQKMDIEEAKRLAKEYLDKIGIHSMRDSYFEIRDNIATINFAFYENEILYYPDLAKVRVALDNGEILGMEAGGYTANHTVRQLPPVRITAEDAQKRLSPALSVEGVQLAVIPRETQDEALCYEFKCKMEAHTFLVYINAETGKEEDVLMLLTTEGGMLTI